MKKRLLIICSFVFIGIFSFTMSNTPAYASAPAELSTTVASQVQQGGALTLTTNVVLGNVLQCLGENMDCIVKGLHFDSSKFDFVSFVSDYLRYDGNTQTFDYTSLEAGNIPGNYVLPFYVSANDSPVTLWTLTLKTRDNATIGETTVYGKKITISAKTAETTNTVAETINISAETSTDNIFFYTTIGLSILVILLVVCLTMVLMKKTKKNSSIETQSETNQDVPNLN